MNLFETAKVILQLLPIIVQAVNTLEEAFPTKGQGAVKLAALKGILQSVYSTTTDTVHNLEQIWPVIQGTVAAIVTAKNTIAGK